MSPKEILGVTVKKAVGKANLSIAGMLLLGFLAGAFIAFGAEASNMAAFNLLSDASTFGLGRVLCASIFPVGLILVILAGAELFTGNTLILAGVLDKEVSWGKMLKNWFFVYVGNLIGAVFIAWMMNYCGLLDSGAGLLGAVTVKIGAGKTSLAFGKAFILGIMCNWLVCLAVWMAFGADSTIGKIFCIFFPIWLFVASGFEHSAANMYYIPAAIMAKVKYMDGALGIGASQEALDSLNWSGFFVDNLIPVTLGNIVGGCIFVAMIYWLVYRKTEK